MSNEKIKILVLPLTILLTVSSFASILQPPQAAYSQTDYEEYIIMESVDQKINQQNIGSGSSTNINCATNMVGTNLAQPIKCPSIPGQSPTPNGNFDTATFSRIIRIEPGTRTGTAEVSCPEGTKVTGGGYELRDFNGETHPLMDAPIDNGWKVSINLDSVGQDAFLTVYAICGAPRDIPFEICDDDIDNDGDTLVDTADPDCAEPLPPRDTDSDGVRDTTDNCDNVPNPGQEDADSDRIGDACDETPFPPENCANGSDDDRDGLIDLEDPDCRPPGEEFRFLLSNCQILTPPTIISCNAEQTSPLPPTYDSFRCRNISLETPPDFGSCSLGRIGGGFNTALCQVNSRDSPETAVCFVETEEE